MKLFISLLVMFVISNFMFGQTDVVLDTLSLKDFNSKEIMIFGSKSDLFLKLGQPNKIFYNRYSLCFQQFSGDDDSVRSDLKRINFISYIYDDLGFQYYDVNDELILSVIGFEKKKNKTLDHPKITFTSKLKLEEFLKIFPNNIMSEEQAIFYFKTKNKHSKAYVVKLYTGYSDCNGAFTEVIFDSQKNLRVIYFNHFNTQQIMP